MLSISGDGGFLFSAMELETAVRLKCNLVHMVWIDLRTTWCAFKKLQNMGGPQAWISVLSMLSGLQRPSVQKGLKIQTPNQISFTIKNALEMQGPVIIGVAQSDLFHN